MGFQSLVNVSTGAIVIGEALFLSYVVIDKCYDFVCNKIWLNKKIKEQKEGIDILNRKIEFGYNTIDFAIKCILNDYFYINHIETRSISVSYSDLDVIKINIRQDDIINEEYRKIIVNNFIKLFNTNAFKYNFVFDFC